MKRIETEAEVTKWVRSALGAVAAQIAITFGALLLAQVITLPARFGDPFALVDVALLALLGVGLYVRSRIAAVCLFLYLVVNEVLIVMEGEHGGIPGLGLTLVIGFAYARAIEACFVHHRLRRDADPGYRPSVIPLVVFAALAVPLAPCLALGGVLHLFGPTAGVVTELDDADLEALRAAMVLAPDEEVVAGYFDGLAAVPDAGALITDRRVLSYGYDGDVLWVDSRERSHIVGVEVRPSELGFGSDLVVSVEDEAPLALTFGIEEEARQFAAHLSVPPAPAGPP